jgi:membrane fusion protein, multidrug efflux system
MVLIPRDAVLTRENRSMVFIARGGSSHWSNVEVGEQPELMAAVSSGIVPGDSIIVDGHVALDHKARIHIGNGSELE